MLATGLTNDLEAVEYTSVTLSHNIIKSETIMQNMTKTGFHNLSAKHSPPTNEYLEPMVKLKNPRRYSVAETTTRQNQEYG